MKRQLNIDVEFTLENIWIYMNKKINLGEKYIIIEKQFSNKEQSLNTIIINTGFLKSLLTVKLLSTKPKFNTKVKIKWTLNVIYLKIKLSEISPVINKYFKEDPEYKIY